MNQNIYPASPAPVIGRSLYADIGNRTTRNPEGRIIRPLITVPAALAAHPFAPPTGGIAFAASSIVDLSVPDGRECALQNLATASANTVVSGGYQLLLNSIVVLDLADILPVLVNNTGTTAGNNILHNIFKINFDLLRCLNFDTTNPLTFIFQIASGDARIIQSTGQ